ncbi:Sec-independent protein translocase protein TatB [Inquilinus sp. CAU 1745]|uniref:Sec-independent protein translocase protein TatB n=1 Tax=Inquilinus sp. CAU 1745 TaxID=3140369 RepID=UPI00325A460E
MFDIGWPELAVIIVVALVVIGPKDLPKALYTVGKWVRAARKVTGDFQRHVDDMMRETELDEMRKTVQKAGQLNIKKQIEDSIDPEGELKSTLGTKPGGVAKASTRTDKPKSDGAKPKTPPPSPDAAPETAPPSAEVDKPATEPEGSASKDSGQDAGDRRTPVSRA